MYVCMYVYIYIYCIYVALVTKQKTGPVENGGRCMSITSNFMSEEVITPNFFPTYLHFSPIPFRRAVSTYAFFDQT